MAQDEQLTILSPEEQWAIDFHAAQLHQRHAHERLRRAQRVADMADNEIARLMAEEKARRAERRAAK